METSVIYKALEYYQLHLQIEVEAFDQSELDAVLRCKEYLENGGIQKTEWLLSNTSILSKAVEHYRHILKSDIEDAKIVGNKEEIDRLRNDREQLLKLANLFV